MTEYDFSPEAYERYLATQVRIANWVDKTEQHRSQFEHAIQQSPPRSASPPARPNQPASYHRSKRSPPPAMNHQGHHPQQFQQPRQLYIHPPSPASESSDDYGDGPGPMPLTSPGIVFPQQQQQHHQHPAAYHPVPMMPHAPMVVPQTYMTVPHHKSSSHHRRRSPHSRSHSHNVQGYYGLPSPPVSPGYQYGYPQMIGGHPGYMVMQPQPPRAMPYMVSKFSIILSIPSNPPAILTSNFDTAEKHILTLFFFFLPLSSICRKKRHYR